ncbi:hypothetical protein COU88_05330 [Candidatus Roizmanbacteria bacterium CG10_big_fil_rev_8_21_14_0_10_39_6]|uniref:Uncharacterized protein n=1 Tax=Candidatus Roizmanbacteria bacterium CG10_big_fil_rev_8_21_14_0_10_39_6 TaxID=1974853 RepID=A0A2M8KR31_9BACT|nr:MAG: hypothetical protein COU88_05330 [Candidatus Roizmanbacteria bacterium CG10_big_fil_rev_8_21_14_0_10_39_6]
MSFIIRIPQTHIPERSSYTKGDTIKIQDSYTTQSKDTVSVDIASELSIPAKDIFKYLIVTLGDVLEEGAIIALKKGLFHTTKLQSPLKAEVRSIDHMQGTITLTRSYMQKDVFLLEGVYEGKEHGEVLLKVKEGLVSEVDFAVNRTFGGPVSYAYDDPSVGLELCKDNIVVTEMDSSIEIAKIVSMDPIALVIGTVVYYSPSVPLVKLKPAALKEAMKKAYPKCIYFANDKVLYWYATDNEAGK